MVSCFVAAALLLMSSIDSLSIREFLELRISLGNLLLVGLFVALWQMLFSAFGLYQGLLFSNVWTQVTGLVKATSIGTCVIVTLAVVFDISFVGAG